MKKQHRIKWDHHCTYQLQIDPNLTMVLKEIYKEKETKWKKKYKKKKIGNKENGATFNRDASSDTNKSTLHNPVNKEI